MDTLKKAVMRMVSIVGQHSTARVQLLNTTAPRRGIGANTSLGFATVAHRAHEPSVSKTFLDFDELAARYSHILRLDSILQKFGSGHSGSVPIKKEVDAEQKIYSKNSKISHGKLPGTNFFEDQCDEDSKNCRCSDKFSKVPKAWKEESEIPWYKMSAPHANNFLGGNFVRGGAGLSTTSPVDSSSLKYLGKNFFEDQYEEDIARANKNFAPHAFSGLCPWVSPEHKVKAWLDLRGRYNHISRIDSISQKVSTGISRPGNISVPKSFDAQELKDSKIFKTDQANFSDGNFFQKDSGASESNASNKKNFVTRKEGFFRAQNSHESKDLYPFKIFKLKKDECSDDAKCISENLYISNFSTSEASREDGQKECRKRAVLKKVEEPSCGSAESSKDLFSSEKYFAEKENGGSQLNSLVHSSPKFLKAQKQELLEARNNGKTTDSCAVKIFKVHNNTFSRKPKFISGNLYASSFFASDFSEALKETGSEECEHCDCSEIPSCGGAQFNEAFIFSGKENGVIQTNSPNHSASKDFIWQKKELGNQKKESPNDLYAAKIFKVKKDKCSYDPKSTDGNLNVSNLAASDSSEAPKENGSEKCENRGLYAVEQEKCSKNSSCRSSKSNSGFIFSEKGVGSSRTNSPKHSSTKDYEPNSLIHSGLKYFVAKKNEIFGARNKDDAKELYPAKLFEAHKEKCTDDPKSISGYLYAVSSGFSRDQQKNGSEESDNGDKYAVEEGESSENSSCGGVESNKSFIFSEKNDEKSLAKSPNHSKYFISLKKECPSAQNKDNSNDLYPIKVFKVEKDNCSDNPKSIRGNSYAVSSEFSKDQQENGAEESENCDTFTVLEEKEPSYESAESKAAREKYFADKEYEISQSLINTGLKLLVAKKDELLESWNKDDSNDLYPGRVFEVEKDEGSNDPKSINGNLYAASSSDSDVSETLQENGSEECENGAVQEEECPEESARGELEEEDPSYDRAESKTSFTAREKYFADKEYEISQSLINTGLKLLVAKKDELLESWNKDDSNDLYPGRVFEVEKDEGSNDPKSINGNLYAASSSDSDVSETLQENGSEECENGAVQEEECPEESSLGDADPNETFVLDEKENGASQRNSPNRSGPKSLVAQKKESIRAQNKEISYYLLPLKIFNVQKYKYSDDRKSISGDLHAGNSSASDFSKAQKVKRSEESENGDLYARQEEECSQNPSGGDEESNEPFKENDDDNSLANSLNHSGSKEFVILKKECPTAENEDNSNNVYPARDFKVQKNKCSDDCKSISGSSYAVSSKLSKDLQENGSEESENCDTHAALKEEEPSCDSAASKKSFTASEEENEISQSVIKSSLKLLVAKKDELLGSWNKDDSNDLYPGKVFGVGKDKCSDDPKSINGNLCAGNSSTSDVSEALEENGSENNAVQEEECPEECSRGGAELNEAFILDEQENRASQKNSPNRSGPKDFVTQKTESIRAQNKEDSSSVLPIKIFKVQKVKSTEKPNSMSENLYAASSSASDVSEALHVNRSEHSKNGDSSAVQEEECSENPVVAESNKYFTTSGNDNIVSLTNSPNYSGSKDFKALKKEFIGAQFKDDAKDLSPAKVFKVQKDKYSDDPTSISGNLYASSFSASELSDALKENITEESEKGNKNSLQEEECSESPSSGDEGSNEHISSGNDNDSPENRDDSNDLYPAKVSKVQKEKRSSEPRSISEDLHGASSELSKDMQNNGSEEEEEQPCDSAESKPSFTSDEKLLDDKENETSQSKSLINSGLSYLVEKKDQLLRVRNRDDSNDLYPAKVSTVLKEKRSSEPRSISEDLHAASSELSEDMQNNGSVEEEEPPCDSAESKTSFTSDEKFLDDKENESSQSKSLINSGLKYLVEKKDQLLRARNRDVTNDLYPGKPHKVQKDKFSDNPKSLSDNLYEASSDFTKDQQVNGAEESEEEEEEECSKDSSLGDDLVFNEQENRSRQTNSPSHSDIIVQKKKLFRAQDSDDSNDPNEFYPVKIFQEDKCSSDSKFTSGNLHGSRIPSLDLSGGQQENGSEEDENDDSYTLLYDKEEEPSCGRAEPQASFISSGKYLVEEENENSQSKSLINSGLKYLVEKKDKLLRARNRDDSNGLYPDNRHKVQKEKCSDNPKSLTENLYETSSENPEFQQKTGSDDLDFSEQENGSRQMNLPNHSEKIVQKKKFPALHFSGDQHENESDEGENDDSYAVFNDKEEEPSYSCAEANSPFISGEKYFGAQRKQKVEARHAKGPVYPFPRYKIMNIKLTY